MTVLTNLDFFGFKKDRNSFSLFLLRSYASYTKCTQYSHFWIVFTTLKMSSRKLKYGIIFKLSSARLNFCKNWSLQPFPILSLKEGRSGKHPPPTPIGFIIKYVQWEIGIKSINLRRSHFLTVTWPHDSDLIISFHVDLSRKENLFTY